MDAHAAGQVPPSQGDDPPIAILAEEHALILRAVELMVAEMDYPEKSGSVAVLSSDHTAGRAHVRAMADAVARLEAEPAAMSELLEHGQVYAVLLRAHIDREDHKVFPTVEDFLGSEERAGLGAAFARFESAEGGQRAVARYADLVGALERHMGRLDRS